jgi:natural product biosynthesis luciferase-like monooxygenase protein/amino acid adenylation domain-containing protein
MASVLSSKTQTLEEFYPLSPMQRGFFYHHISARWPGVDIEQVIGLLHEEMDLRAFEHAWQRVAERQAVLRTRFQWEELDQPRQEVKPHVQIHLEIMDWRDFSPQEREKSLESFLESDRSRGFELTEAPLMRLAILRVGNADYQFIWTFHHLLLDARAIVLVLNEVFAFYEAFRQGCDLELEPAPSFRDHIDWLRKQNVAKAEAFWRQMVAGFAAPTPLTAARPHDPSADLETRPGEQEIRLSAAMTSALKSLAAQNGLTLNTLVQAAWALLLSRYSGEEDVVFGAVRACRHSTVEGADSTVGLFINTVPLRVRLPANRPLLSCLAELRQTWLSLREQEQTPLVNIQGWSEVPRGQPLFETIFNFQDPSWEASLRAQGGPWIHREFSIRSQSNYPLAVDACGGSELSLKILYHRQRFEDGTIARMLGHFKTLLEGMPEHLNEPLVKLPMLTAAERHELLVQWNETRADVPEDRCVHELFEEQAVRTPKALAVSDGKKQLSYQELNRRADELARRLARFGVGPEVRVGVCLERSVEMVVAWLAILKAGGAYLPLDPTYPKDRLAFMLEDARAPVLLTQASLRDRLQFPIARCQWLCMDVADESPVISSHSSDLDALPRTPRTHNLAYIIYTSGSTGLPKGVEIEHASLVNLITWHQHAYGVTHADRATQIATPSFDASVWEVWPYLTAGASLHIPDEETRLAPGQLLNWLAANRITLAFIPTPVAEAMLDEPWPASSTLRTLLTGGDRLRRWPGKNLPCALVNHYGPTEYTVVTTSFAVLPAANNAGPPPIGRPISNTQVYVVDRHLQPVPIGVPGELHIGGIGLARGYHDRPELTGARFISNPFSSQAKARLYKTGDLVRWRPDGHIEFLGRMDHQVKIRGHRIELGEIESLLGRHPGVREAVVIAREDLPGENRLVAYVSPVRQCPPTAGELREFLGQKLPGYMLPAAFVFLDAFPLTPNGKVNPAALPAPELKSEKAFVAPRTASEKMLAEIWCEVLGLQRVGIHDNFFELGGHSLLATQAVSRIRRALHLELPLADLFAAPTVAGLAEKITGARRLAMAREHGATESNLLRIDPSAEVTPPNWTVPNPAHGTSGTALVRTMRNDERPLSFAQERLWFLEQLEPGAAFNNIPIALRLEGTLCETALARSLNEMVRRHETLRTIFRNHEGRPAAFAEPARPLALDILDLGGLPPAERDAQARRLMSNEAGKPFALGQSPLLRVRLLRLAAQEYLLLLTAHHIASDGWSMGIFYRELTALYEAFSQGRSPALPDLPVDYADFADWQRHWLQGEVLGKQLEYWKEQLGGARMTLDLPTDYPRPAAQTYRGATRCFALPEKLSAQLKTLSREEDATLFMLLLAAFQTLLHRYSSQDDILVGSPSAGRTRVEIEGVIGFFLNTLVMRGDLSGDPGFRELLRRTRRMALAAYAHQDVPLEKLVEALQPERDLSRSPVFQVMFILQNEPLPPLELAGIKLTPLHTHSGTAKFDLLLSLEEGSGGLHGFIEYNTDLFGEASIVRMLGHFQTLLEGIVAHPAERLSQLPILTDVEQRQLLVEWNDTRSRYPEDKCVHQLFEEQVERTPEAIAVVFENDELTYQELNHRANQLARELQRLGVGPDVPVGVCVERSLEMMVGLLAILKAGGCYVPLDPAYPPERLSFMLQDSQAPVLLTQAKLRPYLKLDATNLQVLSLDPQHPAFRAAHSASAPSSGVTSDHLAYVIYTSGSTGQPKGVMVSHRNVANLFAGMDRVLGPEPGVWLAVTSISFDISVLELFWTLTRGFKVVLYREDHGSGPARKTAPPGDKPIDFSLFYFASDAGDRGEEKYRLLLEGAKFADANGFTAVWTPERHFHSFGGLYPNPSLTSVALAMITQHIQIRAGSIVLPLHHPIRVAEEWSVVDNLSRGRAAIALASGWQANDFAIAWENYSQRKEIMRRNIDTIQRLWRGEAITTINGLGEPVEIEIFPKPIQRELPIWLTSSGNAETFQLAGELGFDLLTHLSGQGIEQLAQKIEIYREAWRSHGHAPRVGRVSLMLHTFVSDDRAFVWEKVRGPLGHYLRTYRDLSRNGHGGVQDAGGDIELLLQNAVERYVETSGLFGTPETCLPTLDKLKAIGVDEIACLIDFGIDTDSVLASLTHLNQLRERSHRIRNDITPNQVHENGQWRSLPEQILRHGVTHLQCTPSLAGALALVPESLQAMRQLRKLLLGGEALPVSLAKQLREALPGGLFNMYGPTETTVWSTTYPVTRNEKTIPIGRPIANTEIYILDRNLQPVPAGVPGELFIGGDGVARGYLHRSELTAEKFLTHPFHPASPARLYRTGDRARYRADGAIEFLGRLDQQVKLRGFRVELGEIESALSQHPGVRECAVRIWENGPNDQRLAAYLVAALAANPTDGELRRLLAEKLPEHMLPSVFVRLEQLPRTANGKVDRRALPEPEGIRAALGTAYVAPRTELEKSIAKIWRELLRVDKVGLHDNFFDLGGHSLLVVQAQTRLGDALGTDLRVVHLFQYPTISALAKFLGERPEQASFQKARERARRQRDSFARRHREEVPA